MSEEKEAPESERESKDEEAIRALLKRASDPAKEAPPPNLLGGVQRKLRTRSKGKFYADGWSTTHSRVNYALVAVAMLLVMAIAYFALGPMGISAH